jgi:hypothetical protein
LSLVFCPSSLQSQTIPPPYINYQAVLYDVNNPTPNAVFTNQSFQTFVNINDELGNLLYREEHFASTDGNGLITVKMGDGLYVAGPITNFNQINWETGKYYLVVDFNINGTISSTAPEQLVTVPYSFYAGKAGNGMTAVADNGNGTLTFTYANGQTYITPTLSGMQGQVGPAGPAGIQGPQGPAGANGLNALIKTTTEPAGANCANGGTKIETGLDANGNGVLDAGEVNGGQTQFVCSSSNISSGVGFSNMQVFSQPGSFTWTCPNGITKVIIELWGAGGAGKSIGGGGGGYGKSIVDVIPMTTYNVTVGNAGNSSNSNGGNSTFYNLMASGGNFQGSGGTSTCALNIPGEGGKYNQGATLILTGGQAGNGGNGGISTQAGIFPGGGGGANNDGTSIIPGANGLVIIWY